MADKRVALISSFLLLALCSYCRISFVTALVVERANVQIIVNESGGGGDWGGFPRVVW